MSRLRSFSKLAVAGPVSDQFNGKIGASCKLLGRLLPTLNDLRLGLPALPPAAGKACPREFIFEIDILVAFSVS